MSLPAKLLPLPPELMEKARFAERPPKLPKGFFDALVTPTRKMLDNGLLIAEAADWFVEHEVFPRNLREKFRNAMKQRISRLTRTRLQAATYRWMSSPFRDDHHLIPDGFTRAVCGTPTTIWNPATSETIRCARCVGIARAQDLTIAGD